MELVINHFLPNVHHKSEIYPFFICTTIYCNIYCYYVIFLFTFDGNCVMIYILVGW